MMIRGGGFRPRGHGAVMTPGKIYEMRGQDWVFWCMGVGSYRGNLHFDGVSIKGRARSPRLLHLWSRGYDVQLGRGLRS